MVAVRPGATYLDKTIGAYETEKDGARPYQSGRAQVADENESQCTQRISLPWENEGRSPKRHQG